MKTKTQNMEFDVVTSSRTFYKEGIHVRFRSRFKQVNMTIRGDMNLFRPGVVSFHIVCDEFKIDEYTYGAFQKDYNGSRVSAIIIRDGKEIAVCLKISRALPKLNHPKVYNPVIR